MTHYYLYIAAGQTLDTDTAFYKVGIGESAKQVRLRAWLQSYAHDNGHFFVRWSLDAVEFLTKCQESIGIGHREILALSGKELVGILRDGHAEPSSFQAELNRHNMLMKIDPHYYYFYQLQNVEQHYLYGKQKTFIGQARPDHAEEH